MSGNGPRCTSPKVCIRVLRSGHDPNPVFALSVIVLSVFALSVFALSVFALSVFALFVFALDGDATITSD